MSDKDKSKKALVKMNDAWERFRRLVHSDLPGQSTVLDAFIDVAKKKRGY